MIKKGSHLDGVEPITEKTIANDEFLNILGNKINKSSLAYKEIIKLISNKKLYDKSGYSVNSVIIDNGENDDSIVIKISKNNNLHDEYISYNYFYKIGYTSRPINYYRNSGFEIMVSRKIELPTAGYYFNSYKEISSFFGSELRKFHDCDLIKKGFNSTEKELFYKKYEINFEKAISNDVGLVYMFDYLGYTDINEMKRYLIKNKEMLYKNQVLVHGDFNPNNVFITKNKDIRLIDFCDTGICNRHYDIFWTMFMVIIFSGILKDRNKINECETIFLNSYGLDKIDNQELLFFKYFACLYWKQHDEITRIDIL